MNSTFIQNSANRGGAILFDNSWVNIQSCEFIQNQAGFGGAIQITGVLSTRLNIFESFFNGNISPNQGAALWGGGNIHINIINSGFSNNKNRTCNNLDILGIGNTIDDQSCGF